MKSLRECIICGAEFSGNLNTVYCPECRTEEKVKKQKAARRRRPKKTMAEILYELDSYNREHRPRLSYGQYVAKFDNDYNRKGGKKI